MTDDEKLEMMDRASLEKEFIELSCQLEALRKERDDMTKELIDTIKELEQDKARLDKLEQLGIASFYIRKDNGRYMLLASRARWVSEGKTLREAIDAAERGEG
jgi:hypothetical protein